MRKTCLVLCLCMLCGCSANTVSSVESDTESTVTEESEVVSVEDAIVIESMYDTAYGVPCRYVNGEEDVGVLKCRRKEERPEWKVPADGWKLKGREDGMLEVHQVYDADDVLLLPEDYGSNTHVIIGLDGEEETDCEPCSTEE